MKMSGDAVNGARNTKNKKYSQIIITTHFIHKLCSAIQKLVPLSNVDTSFHVTVQTTFSSAKYSETQIPM
jgi:uncharacterized protein YlbG (UPF0298 family)